MQGSRYSIEQVEVDRIYISDHLNQQIYMLFVDELVSPWANTRITVALAAGASSPRFVIFEHEVLNFIFWAASEIQVQDVVREMLTMLYEGDCDLTNPVAWALTYGSELSGMRLNYNRSTNELH
jgi:hypothetical protein